jgi:hypothetical protein
MKIAVCGSRMVVEHMKSLLNGSGVDVIPYIKDGFGRSIGEAESLSDAHLAMIDTVETEPSALLNELPHLRTLPVVFLVNGHWIDWEKLYDAEAFGYVSITGTSNVVASRLKAVMRRLEPVAVAGGAR